MSVNIVSWNLQNLSRKKSDEKLNIIAAELSKYDVAAVQELRDKDVAHILSKKTGMKFILSDPVGSETSGLKGIRKEYYGFFWKDSVQIKTVSNIKATNVFTRTPFAAYFKAKNFDFVLVNIHIVWGKAKDRKQELKHLNDLVEKLQEFCKTEKDLIICGDFNSELCESNCGNWCPALKPPEISNIHGKLYDNFWVPRNTKYLSHGVSKVNDISDHYPIFIEFIDVDNDEDTDIKLDFEMGCKMSKKGTVYSFLKDLENSYDFLFPDKTYFEHYKKFILSLPKEWRDKRFENWKNKKYDICIKDI